MALKSRSLSKTFMWIVMALLMVGLAGFGAVSFTGTQRSIGSVGDQEISLDRYARTLQQEIRAVEAQTRQPLPFPQAQALGLPQQVLSQLVTAAALDHEAFAMGISVGDARLADELRQIPAFQGPDGSFDRQAYGFALQNAGLTEAQFEADLRAETARTLLQGAILSGTAMPDTYTDTLLAFAGERRAFTYATLTDTDLTAPVPVPSDSDLTAWYEDNIDRFTLPETKVLTYVWLTPEMITDSVEVDEDALRAAYDERSAEYNIPERRLVERLVFADNAAAQTAADAIASGETRFEDAVKARGLSLSDIDMGDVTQADLDAAGADVFAAAPGDVVGPLPTSLGPALFRVNGVMAAQSTSFEEAIPDLRGELALDRARRVIETQAQDFDDRLAGGATLEQLASETDMQLGNIAWYPGVDAEIAAYDAFREAATAIGTSDFPAIDGLGDGGIFAMRLDEIRDPAPRPFDDVAEDVAAGWADDQITAALTEQAEALVSRLTQGETFTDIGLTPVEEPGLTRNANARGLPAGVLAAVFDMATSAVQSVPGDAAVTLVRLDDVLPADRTSEEAQALVQALQNQAAGDMAQDIYNALASDIQQRAGVEIDQTAINAVHAQFQ
ncbi:peptidylprolyl isomerase [Aestuariicoccus sp. MJ-SS9]|uniref:peptidylprolyl isomerase n=1 Tax=Aestuariicoccus sp. MJ-SS9 TaxID=3079855 RepID=UPI00291373A4|nr:SurA N-terminal domain-containing protein [Aestuariicoccus sp. MJ-SS9]MDU8912064.1 SurA N-terminal domain-containing protein [Aestuariicoccus sp. MJ-SS9]